jgi:uncharacterized protein (DUF1697 family)
VGVAVAVGGNVAVAVGSVAPAARVWVARGTVVAVAASTCSGSGGVALGAPQPAASTTHPITIRQHQPTRRVFTGGKYNPCGGYNGEMPRYIAFLRAINVGGHTVKMDVLRQHFEALGHTKVETFIASGNVIFDAPGRKGEPIERAIEAALLAALGYEVTTFIRTPAELAAIAVRQPFADYDPKAGDGLYVSFVKSALGSAALKALEGLKNPIDDFYHHGREIYWLRRRRVGESTFSGAQLERAIRGPASARNITTVSKMAAKFST